MSRLDPYGIALCVALATFYGALLGGVATWSLPGALLGIAAGNAGLAVVIVAVRIAESRKESR